MNTEDVLFKEEEKKFQSVKPDNVKTGNGIPLVSNLANLPNMIVKKAVVKSG
jgi:hypothetical protein